MVYEWEDGRIELRYQVRPLPFHRFDKAPQVRQAAIVENKRLSAALEFIRERQEVRDAERLADSNVLLRDKKRIREETKAARET